MGRGRQAHRGLVHRRSFDSTSGQASWSDGRQRRRCPTSIDTWRSPSYASWTANTKGRLIPRDAVAKHIEDWCTGGALTQYLAKLRVRMIVNKTPTSGVSPIPSIPAPIPATSSSQSTKRSCPGSSPSPQTSNSGPSTFRALPTLRQVTGVLALGSASA